MEESSPHTYISPVSDAGIGGALLKLRVLAVLLTQAELALTDTVPVVKVESKSTLIEIPALPVMVIGDVPAVEVTPAGNVHV